MSPYTRRPAGLLVKAGMLLLFLAGCQKGPTRTAPPVPEVVVGRPVRQMIVEWDEYVGRLEAVEFVEVRALVSGYLDSTHFDEGQIVNAGDLLAVIDPRPFVAEVNRAEADVAQSNARIAQQEAAIVKAEAEHRSAQVGHDLALKTVERWRSLFQRNVATQEDLDTREADYAQTRANVDAAAAAVLAAKADLLTARAAVETAYANLELARLNLSYTEVRAPVTGRVSSRSVTEGNLISGGTAQSTLLTTIVSLDPIHCTFDADEAAYLKYVKLAREGKRQSSRDVRQPVYVALANEPDGFPHLGYMDFVENRIDQETDTIRGRAILPNSNMALTPTASAYQTLCNVRTSVRKSGFIRQRSILPRRLSLTGCRFSSDTENRRSQLRLFPKVRSRVRLSSSRKFTSSTQCIDSMLQ